MEPKSNLMKKPVGTKSVRDSARKQDVAHDIIGSFTENHSYLNELHGISHQVVNKNYADHSLDPQNHAQDNDRQPR